jgi:hypothetical protein
MSPDGFFWLPAALGFKYFLGLRRSRFGESRRTVRMFQRKRHGRAGILCTGVGCRYCWRPAVDDPKPTPE